MKRHLLPWRQPIVPPKSCGFQSSRPRKTINRTYSDWFLTVLNPVLVGSEKYQSRSVVVQFVICQYVENMLLLSVVRNKLTA